MSSTPEEEPLPEAPLGALGVRHGALELTAAPNVNVDRKGRERESRYNQARKYAHVFHPITRGLDRGPF